MIVKEEKYIASHNQYLLRPDSMVVTTPYERGARAHIEGMWFRARGAGRRSVSFGTLSVYVLDEKTLNTYEDFLREYRYGRYGGSPSAQWDGDALWTPSAVSLKLQSVYLDILVPALEGFPTIPDGWDGWYDIREKK